MAIIVIVRGVTEISIAVKPTPQCAHLKVHFSTCSDTAYLLRFADSIFIIVVVWESKRAVSF